MYEGRNIRWFCETFSWSKIKVVLYVNYKIQLLVNAWLSKRKKKIANARF